jgi:hypothetical protein
MERNNKDWAETNEIETKKMTQKSTKQNVGSLKRLIKPKNP